MPMTVNYIGSCAFKGCKALTEVSYPKSLTTMENGCFEDCVNLQHFTLFDGLVKIGNTAFRNTGITQIKIPNSVKQIGDEAFANTAIESINIPDGMEDINPRAFEGCKSLQNINVSPQNRIYCNVDGTIYLKEKKIIIRVPVIKSGTYKVPEGVIGIGKYAFSECHQINEVLLPATLEIIGKAAFSGAGLRSIDLSGVKELQEGLFMGCGNLSEVKLPMLEQLPASIFEGCRALTAIELPKSLKVIGKSSFKDCEKLARIALPQSLTTIEDEAFYNCQSIESFEFPLSVTNLGRKTLYDCKNLQSVICPWQVPLEIKDIINNKKTVLRVPSGTEDLYKKAKGWKKFKQIETF